MGFECDSWDHLNLPVQGEKDSGLHFEKPSWRDEGFDKAPANKNKALAVFQGDFATHMFFTGASEHLPNEAAKEAPNKVIRLSTLFWNVALNDSKPESFSEKSKPLFDVNKVQLKFK